MMHGPPNARMPLSRRACYTPAVPVDENAFLTLWDADIERAATAGARLLPGHAVQADDLAQMARCRVLRLLRKRGITSPRYVRRVIKNAILDGVRRERRRPDADPRNCLEVTDIAETAAVDEPVAGDDLADRVSGWIGTLPARLIQVFMLLYVRGLTQRDAALVMGISQPRVARLHAVILQRGRRELMPVAA